MESQETQNFQNNFYKKDKGVLSFLRKRFIFIILALVVAVLIMGFLWIWSGGASFLFKNENKETSSENIFLDKKLSEKDKRDILKNLTDRNSKQKISIEEKRSVLKRVGDSQNKPKTISSEEKVRILENL